MTKTAPRRTERKPINADALYDFLADFQQQAEELHAELADFNREHFLPSGVIPSLAAAIRTAAGTAEHLRCAIACLQTLPEGIDR